MIKLTVSEIMEATGGKLTSTNPSEEVIGFSIDSRTIKPGEFFIAVKGLNFDGHDFIEEAVRKGARGLLLEENSVATANLSGKHIIRVPNTHKAMGDIASRIRSKINVPVVCITGTNGKTTVKDILFFVLSSKYNVLRSKKSYNNLIGVSLTMFDFDETYEYVVAEIGTNRPGEIALLADILKPDITVITNIGDGHLEQFVDREGVFLEKIRVLDFMKGQGIAFLNGDDPLLSKTSVRGVEKRFFGVMPKNNFVIKDINSERGGYSFLINSDPFFSPLKGEHNVYNSSAAIIVGMNCGISPEEINSELEKVSLPEMRLEEISCGNIHFINDSYNANPDSFECALKVLNDKPVIGKKGVVAGDMLELGEQSDEFHRMIGRSIANKKVDFLIVLGKQARHIMDGAIESGMDKAGVLEAVDHCDAAEKIKEMSGPSSIVLLKGSRGTKMEEILKCFTISCTH